MEGGDLGELYTIAVFEVVVVWKEVMLISRTVYIHTAPRHTFDRDAAVGGSRTARPDSIGPEPRALNSALTDLTCVYERYPIELPQL